MSPAAPADPARARRAGASLVEVLVVLAIMSIATGLLLPNGQRLLDQATAHAAFFELQREVNDLRRQAYRSGAPVRIASAGEALPAAQDTDGETLAAAHVLALPSPWTYTLEPELVISDGGVCGPTMARLYRDGEERMVLRMADPNCRFTRLR
jgi:type II secretory pathway pseudopilin PulG